MSKTEGAARDFSLRVDARGVLVRVRARATLELFERIIATMVAHPAFHSRAPAVWDLSESEGLGTMENEDLARMVMISRQARGAASDEPPAYRVAIVAPRDVDFGVGRMVEGAFTRPGELDFGVFRSLVEAERWAFGGGRV